LKKITIDFEKELSSYNIRQFDTKFFFGDFDEEDYGYKIEKTEKGKYSTKQENVYRALLGKK